MIQKTNLIFIIPFLFLFSCCIDSGKDPLKDFVFVKGATIEGAIKADGCTEGIYKNQVQQNKKNFIV